MLLSYDLKIAKMSNILMKNWVEKKLYNHILGEKAIVYFDKVNSVATDELFLLFYAQNALLPLIILCINF